MRVFGIIISSWIVGLALITYARHRFLKPWLSRRHTAYLERENARLDALLRDETTPQRKR